MKHLLFLLALLPLLAQGADFAPRKALTINLGMPVKQCRLSPVQLGGGVQGFAVVFSAEKSIDPYEGSFTFPKDTPKIAVLDPQGRELWRRELPFTIPGLWFMPMLPMDMNGDGVHEIYADGALYDRLGRKILSIGKATLVLAKHILPYGGEQLVVAMPDGKINFWTDANARPSARYDSDIYRANVRQSSSGYNHRYPVLE